MEPKNPVLNPAPPQTGAPSQQPLQQAQDIPPTPSKPQRELSQPREQVRQELISEEELAHEGLPPVITPPPKKSKAGAVATVAALFLLLVSLPTGVFLVTRAPGTQDVASRAANPQDCGSSGFAGWGEDCDTGRGEMVRVVICNDGRHLPNVPTGVKCGPGERRSIAEVKSDRLINSCVKRDCDTVNFSPGRLVCIEEWERADGSGSYRKPGGVTSNTCTKAGSAPPADTSGDTRVNDCKEEQCDRNNFNPGHSICMEEWKRSNGTTYLTPGKDTGKTCGTATTSTATADTGFTCSQNISDCTKTNCQGVAQPDCQATGGVVRACSDNVVRCCYSDGNCYSGQLPAGAAGGGCKNEGGGKVSLTGLKGKTVKVLRMDCPGQTSSTGACSENVKEEAVTIAGASQSFTANGGCGGHQVDVVGFCGSYAFNGTCETKAEAAQVTAAPPPVVGQPSFASQCLNIKIFKGSTLLTKDNFSDEVKQGDTISLTVAGNTNEPGGLDKARFRVNGGSWNETAKKNAGGEFTYDFTVPTKGGSFKFEAMVHNKLLGWR